MRPSTLRVLVALQKARSLRELALELGWSRARVQYRLRRLVAEGLVQEVEPGVFVLKEHSLQLKHDPEIILALLRDLARKTDPPPEGTLLAEAFLPKKELGAWLVGLREFISSRGGSTAWSCSSCPKNPERAWIESKKGDIPPCPESPAGFGTGLDRAAPFCCFPVTRLHGLSRGGLGWS